ncbi:MAG: glycosyltransferase [Nitrospirae bacterium]|nr:glycosyltransferase [Nitrospirota bacterium]
MEKFFIVIFLVITLLGLIAYGLQILATRLTLRERADKSKDKDTPLHLPAISILKPLKGLDDKLFDNLESLCLQDYPEYEIIFSLQDHNDPAYKIARKIKDKYPDKNIRIIVEQCNAGLNPKINNLLPSYRSAKYEYILISDSNVMVGGNYLKEIAMHMQDPEVGLVSNLIQGVGGRTAGAVFENLHLNSFIIGSVCFLDKFLKMPCVVGKSMLMRKRDLESIGGFEGVKDVLAEDYIIGKKIHKMGRKVILSKHVIKNVNEYWGIRKFLNRHTRWGKLRWKIGGIKYFSELIGNPVFISCIPLLLWEPTKVTLSLAFSASFLKIAGDYYTGKILKTDMKSIFYFLSPIKDLIIGLVWFIPIISNTVVWRGNRYIIGKDSLLSPCPERGVWSWKYRIIDAIKMRFA